jgi:hypothetical protein
MPFWSGALVEAPVTGVFGCVDAILEGIYTEVSTTTLLEGTS